MLQVLLWLLYSTYMYTTARKSWYTSTGQLVYAAPITALIAASLHAFCAGRLCNMGMLTIRLMCMPETVHRVGCPTCSCTEVQVAGMQSMFVQ